VRVFFFYPAIGSKKKKTLIQTFSRKREKA
jgi:hypothetical protein